MTLGNALREVANLVDGLEADGVDVEDVDVGGVDAEGVPVSLQLRLTGDPLDEPVETVADVSSSAGELGKTDGRTERESHDDRPADTSTADESLDGSPADDFDAGGPADGSPADVAADDGDDSTDTGDESAVDSDDGIPCRVSDCPETFETEHGMKIHAAKSHTVAESGTDQPHRDPDRLREVYEECETFEEMRDALGTDVTAQTVRRNTMKHGIHEPGARLHSPDERADSTAASGEATVSSGEVTAASSEATVSSGEEATETTSADSTGPAEGHQPDDSADSGMVEPVDSEADEPVDSERNDPGESKDEAIPETGDEDGTATVEDDDRSGRADAPLSAVELPDEFTLPEGIELADVVEAVERSETLYSVQRDLDLDRPTVQELLAALDLLELVHGRVRTKTERDDQKDAIVDRIVRALDDSTAAGNDGHSSRRDGLSADD